MNLSVAICTYNGAARIGAVLERLRTQTGVGTVAWEVLVIDNNSSDGTAAAVGEWQKRWPELRYELEPKQGLALARMHAVRAAQGELVAFLDDDNLPHADWVAAVVRFGSSTPRAGAFSGRIRAAYEVPPPPGIERIESFLAIQDFGPEPCRLQPERLRLPAGAGLIVRRMAWLESIPERQVFIGRMPGLNLAGEDYESLLNIHHRGWEIWYHPSIGIDHAIPAHRLTPSYLRPAARGCGLPMFHLWVLAAGGKHVPWIFVKTFLGNLRHLLWRLFPKRSDLIATAEFEFYLAATISPFFYFWYRRQWQSRP